MQDPFVQHLLNIVANHYHYNPPVSFLQRLAPELGKTPQGRAALGSLSLGGDALGSLYRQYGLTNYPHSSY